MAAVIARVIRANRWRLGVTAASIADPLVRAWATREVLAASDSVYRLTASTVRVDPDARRIVIDTITLTTDAAFNARLSRPYPALNVRFRGCTLSGIDLDALTGGRGLHALRGGCDSASLAERTLVAPVERAGPSREDADSSNFLRFQGRIDLPRMMPHVSIDVVEFPHVHVAFDLLGADGRRSSLAVDSLGVELDSVFVDARGPIAKRRPLFSRDIRVRLDRFEGSTPTAARVSLDHLRADLDDGSCRLDALVYQPAPGGRADSLGFAALRAEHLTLAGVAWRRFLLTGEVAVGRFSVDTLTVRLIAPTRQRARVLHTVTETRHLEAALRAVGRPVRIDSLALRSTTVIERPTARLDSIVTTIRQVSLAHASFGPDEVDWNSPFPIGKVTIVIDGVVRRTRPLNMGLAHLALDASTGRIEADSVLAAPDGDDAAFERRNPYRKSRLSVTMAQVEADGVDLPAYLRRGALRARHLDVHGLVVDVLKDKSKPEDPGPNVVRRSPQAVLRAGGIEIQVDTASADGLVTYRERAASASTHGTLTFGALQVRAYNFSTDPARMTTATPFRLIGDALLMGASALHAEWTVPLLASDFSMRWQGSLGPMNPKAMNPFLVNAVGMRFSGGMFDGAQWNATVSRGLAVGKLTPRWRDLRIELPGIARRDSGLVGGLVRGFAKLAANAFGIHGDNDSVGGHRPRDASITHQWVATETLPQFIWFQLRDPLLLLLKK